MEYPQGYYPPDGTYEVYTLRKSELVLFFRFQLVSGLFQVIPPEDRQRVEEIDDGYFLSILPSGRLHHNVRHRIWKKLCHDQAQAKEFLLDLVRTGGASVFAVVRVFEN